MAIYRAIHTTFWEDTKVLDDMDIEDRYFMLYLLTNPHSNQIGCFEISKRQMCNETGFDLKKINALLTKFENELNVITYSNKTKELFICNWYKYNWSKSPKVKSCIQKELKNVKCEDLQNKINEIFKNVYDSADSKNTKIYGMDTVSIDYPYTMDTLSIDYDKSMQSLCKVYGNNNNKNNNKNKNKKNNKNKQVSSSTTINYNKPIKAVDTATDTYSNFFPFSYILELGKELGVNKNYCKKFYEYYEEKNWLTARGEPIKNIKPLLKKWYDQDKNKLTASDLIDTSEEGIKDDTRRIFKGV